MSEKTGSGGKCESCGKFYPHDDDLIWDLDENVIVCLDCVEKTKKPWNPKEW